MRAFLTFFSVVIVLTLLATAGQTQLQPGHDRANGAGEEAAIRRFMEADINGDGFLTEDEMPPELQEVWREYDVNQDGLIDLNEFIHFSRSAPGNAPASHDLKKRTAK